jgi:hypothetical protein
MPAIVLNHPSLETAEAGHQRGDPFVEVVERHVSILPVMVAVIGAARVGGFVAETGQRRHSGRGIIAAYPGRRTPSGLARSVRPGQGSWPRRYRCGRPSAGHGCWHASWICTDFGASLNRGATDSAAMMLGPLRSLRRWLRGEGRPWQVFQENGPRRSGTVGTDDGVARCVPVGAGRRARAAEGGMACDEVGALHYVE